MQELRGFIITRTFHPHPWQHYKRLLTLLPVMTTHCRIPPIRRWFPPPPPPVRSCVKRHLPTLLVPIVGWRDIRRPKMFALTTIILIIIKALCNGPISLEDNGDICVIGRVTFAQIQQGCDCTIWTPSSSTINVNGLLVSGQGSIGLATQWKYIFEFVTEQQTIYLYVYS